MAGKKLIVSARALRGLDPFDVTDAAAALDDPVVCAAAWAGLVVEKVRELFCSIDNLRSPLGEQDVSVSQAVGYLVDSYQSRFADHIDFGIFDAARHAPISVFGTWRTSYHRATAELLEDVHRALASSLSPLSNALEWEDVSFAATVKRDPTSLDRFLNTMRWQCNLTLENYYDNMDWLATALLQEYELVADKQVPADGAIPESVFAGTIFASAISARPPAWSPADKC